MKLAISRALLKRLLWDAEAAGKAEICGLIVGRDSEVVALQPASNVHPEPERGFALDPAEQIRAARAARAAGKSILGHYHSHPGGSTDPSPADAGQAQEQGVCWLILGKGDARLWVSRRGGQMLGAFEPVELALL